MAGDAMLDLVPDFHLDEITASLFGGDRLASYPFVFAEADRKLVAVEYHELGECIMTGQKAGGGRPPRAAAPWPCATPRSNRACSIAR